MWLAERLCSAEGERERLVAWHHLVFAVGNFKREGGRRLHPTRLCETSCTSTGPRPATVPVPVVGAEVVNVDDPETWIALRRNLKGAGVPTTTTLLAALWPERHFVFDWRVRTAANGVRIAGGLQPAPGIVADDAAVTAAQVRFVDYRPVRDWLLEAAATTGASLTDLERALYVLSRDGPSPKGTSWAEYGRSVLAFVGGRAAQL